MCQSLLQPLRTYHPYFYLHCCNHCHLTSNFILNVFITIYAITDTTHLITSHLEGYHGDVVTLICSYHNIGEQVHGRPIFNSTNPFWRMNNQLLPNSSYQTLLITPYASSIQVTVNSTTKEGDVNYSCFTLLNDGWKEESNIVTISILEETRTS